MSNSVSAIVLFAAMSVAMWGQTAEELFQRNCASCHGKGGHGGRAPDLTRVSFTSDNVEKELFRTISDGIDGTEMESYSKRLGEEKIRLLVGFLRSGVNGAPAMNGDAARGKTIFWGKGGCGNCHAVAGQGNRMGPDLTRIGRRRNPEYLRESLVDPGADIIQGYGGVTVTAKDGKTLRGIERALDDFSVVLQDFSGKVYSFERASVQSVKRDSDSLMPAYGKALAAAEMDDLMAYLMTLGKAEVKP